MNNPNDTPRTDTLMVNGCIATPPPAPSGEVWPEISRLRQKIAERDHLVRTSNRLAKEEAKIMQRWKEWGLEQEEARKKLEAEVEKLDAERRELSRLLHLHEMGMYHKPKMQATIDTLRSQLTRAVEIAETSCQYLDNGGWNENEMYSGKAGWVTETEINEVCASLAALKSEIRNTSMSESADNLR